jgi:hypothetical protein
MILQLVDVARRDRLTPLGEAAPPLDLPLQVRTQAHRAHPTVGAGAGAGCVLCQAWRNASATTVHCSCRSASAAGQTG